MIKKIFHTTIAKVIIGIIAIYAADVLSFLLFNNLFRLVPIPQVVRLIAIPIITITIIIITYIALCRYCEKRKITEFSTNNIGKYLGVGLLLGLLLPSLSILVAYWRGEYIILSISNLTNVFFRDLTISIGFGISGAVFEEVLFRGVLFRLIEEKLGSFIALVISCVIFGFAHLINDSSALFGMYNKHIHNSSVHVYKKFVVFHCDSFCMELCHWRYFWNTCIRRPCIKFINEFTFRRLKMVYRWRVGHRGYCSNSNFLFYCRNIIIIHVPQKRKHRETTDFKKHK